MSSHIAFFPWLTLDAPKQVGSYRLLPYDRQSGGKEISDNLNDLIDRVLEPYIVHGEQPIQRVVLLEYADKEIGEELLEHEQAELQDFAELLAISAMAQRRYLGSGLPDTYSNRSLFELSIMSVSGEGKITTTFSRRRDGQTQHMVTRSAYRIHKPRYVPGAAVSHRINFELCRGLILARRELSDDDWARMFDAIRNYNLANTDSPIVIPHMEHVLLAGAFERLEDVEGDGRQLAGSFGELFGQDNPINPTEAQRLRERDHTKDFSENYESMSEVWMHDFYIVRDKLAHGQREPEYQSPWDPAEHLLFASSSLPLLLARILHAKGYYTLTTQEVASAQAVEKLASITDWNEEVNGSSRWSQIVSDCYFSTLNQHWGYPSAD